MVVRSGCCGGGEGGEVMWRGGSGGDDDVVVMVDRGDVVGRRWVAWRGGWWPDLVAGGLAEKVWRHRKTSRK
ncbi:hypothetical protein Tco_0963083 [Tanacetum coccineum]